MGRLGRRQYFPSLRLLHVPDGAWVRVTAAQAAMIAADLHPRGRPAGGVGAGSAIAIAAARARGGARRGLAAARRRRPWRRPQAA